MCSALNYVADMLSDAYDILRNYFGGMSLQQPGANADERLNR